MYSIQFKDIVDKVHEMHPNLKIYWGYSHNYGKRKLTHHNALFEAFEYLKVEASTMAKKHSKILKDFYDTQYIFQLFFVRATSKNTTSIW